MRLLLTLLFVIPITTQAQEFPQRGPLEITVLFPAGSSADVTARMLADGMSKALGQRVLVVNRPGAGGAIGYRYVASQKPDGYSLVWNSNSISTTSKNTTRSITSDSPRSTTSSRSRTSARPSCSSTASSAKTATSSTCSRRTTRS